VVPFKLWRAAVTLAAAPCAATILAPTASAAGADVVIADLQNDGYIVQINWINGFNTKPLPECTVTNVNDPSSAPMKPGDTVYVDVRCPNHDYDDDGGSFGVGIGIG
jgi:hypothetical protein